MSTDFSLVHYYTVVLLCVYVLVQIVTHAKERTDDSLPFTDSFSCFRSSVILSESVRAEATCFASCLVRLARLQSVVPATETGTGTGTGTGIDTMRLLSITLPSWQMPIPPQTQLSHLSHCHSLNHTGTLRDRIDLDLLRFCRVRESQAVKS